jgi:hypothetical protein
VNRSTSRQSTTATPSGRKFTSGPIALALAPTASAFTLPFSVHALGRNDMGLAVIIGIAPALASLLIVVTLATAYAVAFLVAVLVTFGRLLRGRVDAATCVEDLFRHVINPPISIWTLTPVKAVRSATSATKRGTATVAESPLPAVPGAARNEIESLYLKIKREMGIEPEAKPEVVPEPVVPEPEVIEPSRGRHAKPEAAEPEAALKVAEVFAPGVEPVVDVEPAAKVAA